MRRQEYELLLKNITTSEFHKRLGDATAKFSGINAMDSVDRYFYGETPGKFWIDYIPDMTMNFDTSGKCPTRLFGNVYVQGDDLLVRYTFRKNKSYSPFTVIGIVASGIVGLEGAWTIWLSFYGQGEGVFIGSWLLIGGILFFLMSFSQIRIKKSQKIKLVNFLKEAVER
ncbi:MAG: hypothetical protein HFH25_03805 [Lachnospiraceae bacterium]|nr:hypothetical protein [Lachnospiraceae bacterium]